MQEYLTAIGYRLKRIQKVHADLRKERDEMQKAGRVLVEYMKLLGAGKAADARMSADIKWAVKKISTHQ